MVFHSILVQITNYGDIPTIVLMLVFHFLSVLFFTLFQTMFSPGNLNSSAGSSQKRKSLAMSWKVLRFTLLKKTRSRKLWGGEKQFQTNKVFSWLSAQPLATIYNLTILSKIFAEAKSFFVTCSISSCMKDISS